MKIPKTCAECNFNNLVSSGIVACKFRPNYHYDIPDEGRPVWCQLDNPTLQELITDAEKWRILKKHYWDRIGANADGLAKRYSKYEKTAEGEGV